MILGIIFLPFLLSMFYVDESNAQTLSGLTSSLPTQQAANSTAVITVTASPPTNFTSRYWQIEWKSDDAGIGNAVFDYSGMSTSASVTNAAFSRADINVSMPMSPNNQFTSSLILRELQLNDSGKVISAEVDADGGTSTPLPPLMFTLMVKHCPSSISSDITVEATSYSYNAQGTFQCSNNGELFYSNGARPTSSDTICLASATWSDQDNLQCWAAPKDVTLGGNLTAVEANNITVTCDYVDAIPYGNFSIFHVGNNTHTKFKNETLVLPSLQRSDNNKVVSCQAVTPYTQILANNNTGKSSNHTINVQYAPYQEIQCSCTWVVNQTESCQVEFFSNPQSEFVSLSLNKNLVTNDGSNKISSFEYIQTFYFNRTEVTNDDNGAYVLMVRSSMFPGHFTISFVIVVVDRLPTTTTITTTPTMTTTTLIPANNNQALIIGASCGAVAGVILIIVVLMLVLRKRGAQKEKDGSSTVHINPTFNVDANTGKVNEQAHSLHGESISHDYVASANAQVDRKEIKEEKVNPLYAASSESVEQVGAVHAEVDVKKKKKHKRKNGGEVNEQVHSLHGESISRDHVASANAQVDRKCNEEIKEEKINPLYAASSEPVEQVGAAYAEVDVKKKKNGELYGKEEKINPLYVPSDQPEQINPTYAEVDIKEKKKSKKKKNKINDIKENLKTLSCHSNPSERIDSAYAEEDVKKKKKKIKKKEEKTNPPYVSSDQPEQIGAAFTTVDMKKKKKKSNAKTEKEDKINPLYISSDQPEQMETAYAAVDLKIKKKNEAMNEKEERINPLYAPSSSRDHVEEAYAAVDKNKKKPKPAAMNEKEERVNPLHAPSSSRDHVEEAYAAVDKSKKKPKPAAKNP